MIDYIKTQNRIDSYRKLVNLCFPLSVSSFIFDATVKNFFEISNQNSILGLFDDNKLCSGLLNYTFDTKVFSKITKSLGVGFVVSDPTSRGKGNIKKLFEKTLLDYSALGFVYSGLYPFSFPFYKKLGYGVASHDFAIKLNPKNISTDKLGIDNVSLTDIDNGSVSKLIGIMNDMTNAYFQVGMLEFNNEANCNMYRELYQSLNCKLFISDNYAIVLNIGKPAIEIKHFVYRNDRGLKMALNFLSSFANQCEYINLATNYLTYRKILFSAKDTKLESNSFIRSMVRVINVETALKDKWDQDKGLIDKEFTLHIKDDIIANNNKGYRISENSLKEIEFNLLLAIDISDFSPLLIGSVDIEEFNFYSDFKYNFDFDNKFFYKNFNVHFNAHF